MYSSFSKMKSYCTLCIHYKNHFFSVAHTEYITFFFLSFFSFATVFFLSLPSLFLSSLYALSSLWVFWWWICWLGRGGLGLSISACWLIRWLGRGGLGLPISAWWLIRWLGLADLDVVVVNGVVVDSVAWACRSWPGFTDLGLGLLISSFSLSTWWWLNGIK